MKRTSCASLNFNGSRNLREEATDNLFSAEVTTEYIDSFSASIKQTAFFDFEKQHAQEVPVMKLR